MKLVDGICSGSGMDLFKFAGAFKAAKEAGYVFKRYAGVSGGAIVACACAAGYEPGEELDNAMLALTPISDLLDPELLWPWSRRADRGTVLSSRMPWWWPFRSHGAVRGKKLEKVIDTALRAKGVVRFKDLKKPLKVYTTRIGPGPVIDCEWSTEKTPDALVAPVVMASARIPGLFQEAKLRAGPTLEAAFHVDGGLWANFPIDCFECLGEDTIGFYFGHEVSARGDFSRMLAMVDILMASRAAEDIKDAPKAHVVVLPPGNPFNFFIDRTQASRLIEEGYLATKAWCVKHPAE